MRERAGEHGWNQRLPSARAYKRRAGAVAPTIEQDRAAGGRHHRSVDLGDGNFARASVSLRVYRRTRRIRAYLRWSQDGKSVERYICEVTLNSRRDNLVQAWRQAHEQGLVTDVPLPPESTASSPAVRAVMRANRGKDTGPELALRRQLYGRGLRYRVTARPLPGLRRTADIVFAADRVAVFVDGCFWHGCPEHHRPAARNSGFWLAKIAANQHRDRDTSMRLREAGWTVIRVWEHEDPELAAERVETTIRELRDARTSGRTSELRPSSTRGPT
ncbi:very short patch repair endonuclease [Nocardia asteroides]|uniref:very short patch repair endonuclease n=1 Tax=Nocardia asteroides TaxID=1824 RepID=UPI0034237DCB